MQVKILLVSSELVNIFSKYCDVALLVIFNDG